MDSPRFRLVPISAAHPFRLQQIPLEAELANGDDRNWEALLAAAQGVWVRRPPMPAKQIGLRQMGMGLALVAVTAVGVLW